MRLQRVLKLINPLIFVSNWVRYLAHLGDGVAPKPSDPYDFSKDREYL